MNRKSVSSILMAVTLVTSLIFVSCGAFDDNSQPMIEPITDKTVDAGDNRSVNINITDADVDDTHTISAFADDTSIATVSVDEDSLTLIGIAVGTTTITVSATDDSGQDNAAATPVTFAVTVNPRAPQVTIGFGGDHPPSDLIDKGACAVGMTLKPGESCSYDSNNPFAEIIFSVLPDGSVCREQVPLLRGRLELPEQVRPRNLKFCVEWDIEQDDFFGTSFAASKNLDGSWTVKNVP